MIRKTGKGIWFVLLLVFLLTETAGCGNQKDYRKDNPDRKLRIVCTIFPEYDWVKQILGRREEETELTLLMKNGADLHSYQPTVWDMRAISEADLFVYVGGESDFWVEEALEHAGNPDCRMLNLMELLQDAAKTEEYTEGMQTVQGHGHDPKTEAEEHRMRNMMNISGCLFEMPGPYAMRSQRPLVNWMPGIGIFMNRITERIRKSFMGWIWNIKGQWNRRPCRCCCLATVFRSGI